MDVAAPSLPALEEPWAVAAREDSDLLAQIARQVSGPFHLIHPATFGNNLAAFQQVLHERGVSGQVYFGKKANKAGAWLREVAGRGGAVDVASVPEFVHSLANGIPGARIGVTGAAKSNELLWLAASHGATVAIDALDELERAIAIARETAPLRILLRALPDEASTSRFGLNNRDLDRALARCLDARPNIAVEGFSFHLDGYAVAPRAEQAFRMTDLVLEARERGHPCQAISIGGGFACAYVEEAAWEAFKAALTPKIFHTEKRFSHFYPYYQSPTGADMLAAILDSRRPGENQTLAQRLVQTGISIQLEPGRALLIGAGMSVFPVQGFKQNRDYGMVTVAGLSMSLSEQWKNSEFLPDPLLVQRGDARPQRQAIAAVAGSSCMEYDVLSWRKIRFPAEPRYGDFVIYPNTAGYQMDKNETEFHQLPLPPRIVVSEHDGQFTWRRDQ